MSQTIQGVTDAYLTGQTLPTQELKLEEYTTKAGKGFSVRLLTPVGRLSYVHFSKPHAVNATDGKAQFGATLIMAPETISQIWKAIQMIAEKKAPTIGVQMLGNGTWNMPLKNGDIYVAKQQIALAQKKGATAFDPAQFPKDVVDGLRAYAGMWTINPKGGFDQDGNPKRPVLVDERQAPCMPDRFYSGCYARFFLTISAIADHQPTKGITSYLDSVQFVRNGEKIGGFDAGGQAIAAFAANPIPVDPNAPVGGLPFGGQSGPANVPAGFAAPPSGTAPWAPPPAQQAPAQPSNLPPR